MFDEWPWLSHRSVENLRSGTWPVPHRLPDTSCRMKLCIIGVQLRNTNRRLEPHSTLGVSRIDLLPYCNVRYGYRRLWLYVFMASMWSTWTRQVGTIAVVSTLRVRRFEHLIQTNHVIGFPLSYRARVQKCLSKLFAPSPGIGVSARQTMVISSAVGTGCLLFLWLS